MATLKKKNKKDKSQGQIGSKNIQNNPIQTIDSKPNTTTKLVTAEDVISSTSQAEFDTKKEKLFKQFMEEVQYWEEEGKKAREKAEKEEAKRQKSEQEKTDLDNEIKRLRKDFETVQKDTESLKKDAESYSKRIRAEADEIKKNADKERLEKLQQASDDAKAVWQGKIDHLTQQIKSLTELEQKIFDERKDLDRDKLLFEEDKEALEELKEALKASKKRYDEASPAKITLLEAQLNFEKDTVAALRESRDELSKRAAFLESLMDSVKTEIEDTEQGVHIASVKDVVSALQKMRDEYNRLASIYSKYPDDAAITKIEEKAKEAEKLEQVNDALLLERNRYREEAFAAKNAKKALETVQQEVEATNALNEHLLQELESHKTALESRTGDTCPSLSKVDTETETDEFKSDIVGRVRKPKLYTLREIVAHVKNYAGSRSSEEKLYYTDNDIRAFLAGMSVSRLIILQGMSGTGKSSLPRIFSEAVSGFNKLIPVESSWRDRNELLGYYNDFNKKFNAKSFTIELYRSSKDRCQQIPTFIVLDEMNLSRIEYYFSDFLAILQEPDHDKWLIELVASDMRTLPMELPDNVKTKMEKEAPSIFSIWEKMERARQGDLKSETSDEDKELLTNYLEKLGQLTGAKSLIDGRKIKVTDNIWFVGTANRDESTFEISDKVYDRAQVVSLNRKGLSEGTYVPTGAKFISVSELEALFNEAITRNNTRREVEERLNKLDDVLIDKFDVSFGNRIVTQTINFVAVFVAAGGTIEDALDYQISTKILRKVITSDNADSILALLESVKDYKETTRLLEKRWKEL